VAERAVNDRQRAYRRARRRATAWRWFRSWAFGGELRQSRFSSARWTHQRHELYVAGMEQAYEILAFSVAADDRGWRRRPNTSCADSALTDQGYQCSRSSLATEW